MISTPERQGLDSERMNEALQYLASHSLHNGNKEVLIIRNGYQVYGGENIDSTHNIWSCSKTFTSTVLGLLVDDGVLKLDDFAAQDEPLLADAYSGIRYRHFASMTSGYSAEGDSRWSDTDYADWSWTVYTPESPMFAPGTAFAYWDEAQMMFGRCLTQVLDEPMHDYLVRRITDPIGMGEDGHPPQQDAVYGEFLRLLGEAIF